jgi:hypothetical protein
VVEERVVLGLKMAASGMAMPVSSVVVGQAKTK